MTTGHDLGDWMCVIRDVQVWNSVQCAQRNKKMLLSEIEVMCGRGECCIFLELFSNFLAFLIHLLKDIFSP